MGSKWKKFVAVSCSHGWAIDTESRDVVLDFCEKFKPDARIHIGDAFDMTAYRSNAKGSKDECADIGADWSAGVDFLERFGTTVFMCGNHEHRIYTLQNAANSIVSKHAYDACKQLEKQCKRLRAKFIPYDSEKGWYQIGDLTFTHGYRHHTNALKWHADHVGGDVAMGHIHTCEDREFEGLGGRRGFVIGMLANAQLLDYAKTWPSRSRWQNGFLWGEYNNKYTIANLCRKHRKAGWRLPPV